MKNPLLSRLSVTGAFFLLCLLVASCGGVDHKPLEMPGAAPTVISIRATLVEVLPARDSVQTVDIGAVTTEDFNPELTSIGTESTESVEAQSIDQVDAPIPQSVSVNEALAPMEAAPTVLATAPDQSVVRGPREWTSLVVPSSRSVRNGRAISIITTLENRKPSIVIMDLEIYDPSGRKVDQLASQNMYFAAGQHQISRSWKVPHGLSPGTYTVAVGVFSGDWKSTLHWVNPASSFDVLSN
jgi:hypothetical protein